MGANKRPFYRVVVADQRSPRNGRFIENIGRYHPLEEPSLIEIDEERALHWLRVGAQPSNQVRNLMDKIGIWSKFVAERPSAAIPPKPGRSADAPKPEKVSKKAATKAKAAAAAPPPAAAPESVEPTAEAEEAPTESTTDAEPAAQE
jgi:small subunit ribosomal protein S16